MHVFHLLDFFACFCCLSLSTQWWWKHSVFCVIIPQSSIEKSSEALNSGRLVNPQTEIKADFLALDIETILAILTNSYEQVEILTVFFLWGYPKEEPEIRAWAQVVYLFGNKSVLGIGWHLCHRWCPQHHPDPTAITLNPLCLPLQGDVWLMTLKIHKRIQVFHFWVNTPDN